MKFRTFIPITLIFAGFASVIFFLWDQEFKNYIPSGDHSDLVLNSKMALDFLPEEKPAYLHFFSNECRNARINISHISRIISKYDDQVTFFVINSGNLSSEILRKRYGLPDQVRIVDDSDRRLTNSLNVKSVPYALISTADHRLFFGGNYNNKNGLCSSGEIIWSSPAVALKFLVKDQNPPLFPGHQLDFIGCGT